VHPGTSVRKNWGPAHISKVKLYELGAITEKKRGIR
jgi:hypothetical protein